MWYSHGSLDTVSFAAEQRKSCSMTVHKRFMAVSQTIREKGYRETKAVSSKGQPTIEHHQSTIVVILAVVVVLGTTSYYY